MWQLHEENMKLPFEKGPQRKSNLGQDDQFLHLCLLLQMYHT